MVTVAHALRCRAPKENAHAPSFQSYADSMDKVVSNCDVDGNCTPLGPGEISAEVFRCGELDDLSVALTGLHLNDVWLSRMEANLPRAALDQDLLFEASSLQINVENRVVPDQHDNHPCDQQASIAPLSKATRRRLPLGPAAPTLLAAGLFWAYRRRRGR
jgi:hypothetical protein